MKWKVLKQTYIFNNPPWLTIREDKVKLKNGSVLDAYYVYEYPNWVNTIALTKDKKFVFVKQYRHALGEVNYELSAGVCDDKDADPLESAQRELLEETGYGNGNWSLWMVNSANPGTHSNLTYCYVASDVELVQDQALDDTEEMTVHLLDRHDVIELLNRNEIRQSLHAAALWKYMALVDYDCGNME